MDTHGAAADRADYAAGDLADLARRGFAGRDRYALRGRRRAPLPVRVVVRLFVIAFAVLWVYIFVHNGGMH